MTTLPGGTGSVVLQWLPCQAPGGTGSVVLQWLPCQAVQAQWYFSDYPARRYRLSGTSVSTLPSARRRRLSGTSVATLSGGTGSVVIQCLPCQARAGSVVLQWLPCQAVQAQWYFSDYPARRQAVQAQWYFSHYPARRQAVQAQWYFSDYPARRYRLSGTLVTTLPGGTGSVVL